MDTGHGTPTRTSIADDIAQDALIVRYLAGPALVRETIAGMDEAQLQARPIPGKMSTHDVVTHIVDSEGGLGGRVKRAIAGEEVPVVGGRHPEVVCDPDRDLDADLDLLTAKREQLAEELRALPADGWEVVALRRDDRTMTVRQVIVLMVRHLENHVATIEEKKAVLGL
ncbi:MAG TPA: DinB family protein [Coriobacteriia bacterium]